MSVMQGKHSCSRCDRLAITNHKALGNSGALFVVEEHILFHPHKLIKN